MLNFCIFLCITEGGCFTFVSLLLPNIKAFWFLIAESEFKAELPWSSKNDGEKRHEAEFKRRILDLSKVRKRGNVS